MSNNLVIVESPAKVKTIKKFLGSNYQVDASGGHVRDLPKSQLGFDPENSFEPKYITIRGKGDVLARLRREVKKADKIFLATDPDREGEAISWHLLKALKLDENSDKKVYRITFNEITKNAVKASLKAPRDIDMNLVDAQQARRMLDRMVGYRISPLIWAKVKRGLSAGRVQSVALRMICDREAEIDAFIPEEYWTLDAKVSVPGSKKALLAHYYGKSKKAALTSEADCEKIENEVKGCPFTVAEIKTGERSRKAPLPFTTSTLQQEASKALNFSTQKTMRLAQQLYEGVDLKGKDSIALITYLRTDSTRVSEEADKSAREYIAANYGANYTSESTSVKNNEHAQDAHEAIRPTDITITPVMVKDSLPRDLYRLYSLIWRRFAASRMKPALYETTTVKLSANDHIFTMSGSRPVFDGFMSVYTDADDEKEEKNVLSDKLTEGMTLEASEIISNQHFTQPAPHFTEASLVKALEEQGIGRPSTYAPTITTILARHYITKENKNLFVTDLGEAVNKIMVQAFPTIIDLKFTANVEYLLDSIGEGLVSWKSVVGNFYPDLDEAVKAADEKLEHVKILDEVTDEICEECGRNMVIKYGPHGKFLACPGFPDCRNTKPYLEKIGVKCPKCGKDIVIRKSKKGRRYFGCESYPDCDFMSWQKPSSELCPQCGGFMIEKGNKLLCGNTECGFVKKLSEK